MQQTQETHKWYHSLSEWVLIAFTTLLPFFLLPLTNNPVIYGKDLIFFITGTLGLFAFAVQGWQKKKWEFIISPISIGFLLLGIITLVSSLTSNTYPTEHLLGLGGWLLSSASITLFLPNLVSTKVLSKVQSGWILGSLILALSTIATAFKYGHALLLNKLFAYQLPNNLSFSLAGDNLTALLVLTVALFLLLFKIVKEKKAEIWELVAGLLIVIAVLLNGWSLLPNQPTTILMPNWSASWSIAIDSLKTPKQAIIGQGPQSYLNAYTAYRPVWLNGQNNWQINFLSGNGFLLTFIVTLGISGAGVWLWLVLSSLKHYNSTSEEPWSVLLAVLMLTSLFLPVSNILIIAITIVATSVSIVQASRLPKFRIEASSIHLITNSENFLANKHKSDNHLVNGLIALLLILVSGYLSLTIAKVFTSYIQLGLANRYANNNDAVKTYQYRRQAVLTNPYLDEIRRDYALTNLQLALALSNNAELTDEQKTQVTALISQATNEARASTILDPYDHRNWAVLAEVYKNLIGVAEGADQWAISSLVNAIQAYPTNPIYRLDLGNIFFSGKQYPQAANLYSQAVELKPDLANAHYLLAQSLLAQNQDEQAINYLQQAMLLTPTDSTDYPTVKQEFDQLLGKLQASASAKKVANDQQRLNNPSPDDQENPTGLKQLESAPLSPINDGSLDKQPAEKLNPATELEL